MTREADGSCHDQTADFQPINGRLAMDMGGTHPGASQHVDLDRLGLTAGEPVSIHFFYDQRSENRAAFGLRTTMVLINRSVGAPNVSSIFD